MEAKKVLVKEGDVAIITCPFCRKTKKLSVAPFKEKRKRELRIKCSCEKIFSICLECRKHQRKDVKLLGKSINLSQHRKSQDIIIINISLGGIGFNPMKMYEIRKDDRLQVSFSLNDSNNTPIETAATVRAVSKDYVGCEFNTTESFKPTLGFYLLG
jgi:hypothetical protein